MNRLEEFLKELSELTKKYELKIDGCGCCESPRIRGLKDNSYAGGNLNYDEKEQKYKLGDEGEDEFEDDEDEDDEEDDAEYKAFCKQFLNADEKWKLVKEGSDDE